MNNCSIISEQFACGFPTYGIFFILVHSETHKTSYRGLGMLRPVGFLFFAICDFKTNKNLKLKT